MRRVGMGWGYVCGVEKTRGKKKKKRMDARKERKNNKKNKIDKCYHNIFTIFHNKF